MKIKISNLSDGTHNFLFTGELGEIGLAEPFIEKYRLSLEMDKSAHQIHLRVLLEVKAELSCDKCTKSYQEDVPVEFEMVYLFGEEPVDDVEPNVVYLPYTADSIDISDEIYDFAYLSVPMRKVCEEACKGLCPHCGIDLNEGNCDCTDDSVDPRWEPLLKLKNKLNEN